MRKVETLEDSKIFSNTGFSSSDEFSDQVKGDSKNSGSGNQQGVFRAGQY